MESAQGTPLGEIAGWPDELAHALQKKAIYSAEQVVAIAATPSGIESLAVELAVTTDEARRLVALARAQLAPGAAAALERPAPRKSLGAVPPQCDGSGSSAGR